MENPAEDVYVALANCLQYAKESSFEGVSPILGAIVILIDAENNRRITICGDIHKQVAMGCCLEAAYIVDNKDAKDQMNQLYASAMAQFEKAMSGKPDN